MHSIVQIVQLSVESKTRIINLKEWEEIIFEVYSYESLFVFPHFAEVFVTL